MSAANLQGVSDMSIFYNNTFDDRKVQKVYLVGRSLFKFCVSKNSRIQDKPIKLIIVTY